MKFSFQLALVLFCQISFAQTVISVETYNMNGQKGSMDIDFAQFYKPLSEREDISPSILIVEPDQIFVPPHLQEEFYAFLAKERELWKFRYLRNNADSYSPSNPVDKMVGDTESNNKESGDYFMIAARLKEGLSLKMKQAFINPYVYSRYIPNLKEYSLGELAASHYTQYALCLDNIKMDTLKAEQYVATADLVVADSTSKDSLCYQVNISASGATLQQCMDKLLEQAHAKILIFASKNPESRKIWSLQSQRSNALQSNFPQALNKDQMKVLKRAEREEELYFHQWTDESQSRFVALGMRAYQPEIEECIPKNFFERPYPEIDLDEFSDPLQAPYYGWTSLAMQVDEEWYITDTYGETIHANSIEAAKQQFLKKSQKIEMFESGTSTWKEDFWTSGPFQMIDSTYLFETIVSKHKDSSSLLSYQNNYLPFIGLPLFEARGREFKERLGHIIENREYTELYYDKVLKRLIKSDDSILLVTYSFGSIGALHDLNRRHNIFPVMVHLPGERVVARFYYWDQRLERELYHWHLIPDIELVNDADIAREFGKAVTTHIKEVYPWDFGFHSVNEPWFWGGKVLKKDKDGNYLYLKKVL